ncbi:MAG: hypothetical protein ACI33M_12235 [Lysinibacillus sp.]
MSLTKQWEVEEVFTFPLELGCVKEDKKINVQVNWEAKQLMEVIHIRGIYHITAKVRFGLERQAQFSPGTLIEHIDLEGDEGYFEYAIPFSLELPNVELKDLRVEDIKTTCQDSLHIAWQVICVYDELTTTTDEVQKDNYLEIPKVDIKEQIMEEMKAQAKIEEMVEQKVKEKVEQIVEPIAEEKVAPKKEQNVEVKEEVWVQPVQEIVEELIEESTNDESSHETRNDYVNESINRILEDRIDDSTEFIFQLEDSYRKQSVPLNKIRQQ